MAFLHEGYGGKQDEYGNYATITCILPPYGAMAQYQLGADVSFGERATGKDREGNEKV